MDPIAQTFVIRNQAALRGVRATYHLLVHGDDGFDANLNMTSIEVDRGHVWVNGIPLHLPRFTADHITWRQHTTQGYSAGQLYLYDGGLSVHGAISQGSTARTPTRFDVVGTAIKPVVYKTRISKSAPPIGTKLPASDFVDGLKLEVGYEMRVGETAPRPTVALDDQDITAQTTWLVDCKGRTVLRINLDSFVCSLFPKLYKTAWIGFDPYDMSAHGSGMVLASCTAESPAGTARLWTAEPVMKTARFALAKRAAPVAQLVAAADSLRVDELITLLPDDQVNQDANSMLLRNMKWAMGQDATEREWLARFFGQTPPAGIPDSQTELIRPSLDWYQNKFAKAYMTQSFNTYTGPNAPSTRLGEDEAKRLDTFLRTGLAKSSDFSVQHQAIYIDAYIGVQSRLADYLADDKKNKTNWAKRVFDQLTGGSQFTLMVNRVAGAAGDPAATAPLNNFACLLTALDRSGATASAYYKSVLSGVIVKLAAETNQQDKDTVMHWLPKAMETYLRALADGNIPGQSDISKAQALEIYQEYMAHSTAIAADMADLLQSITAMNLFSRAQKFEEGFQTIADKYPKLAMAGRGLFVIGWIGGIAGIITVLAKGDWNKMTEVEKAQFVTSCAQSVIQAFQAVPEIFSGVQAVSLKVWNRIMESLQTPANQTATQNLVERTAGGENPEYVLMENVQQGVESAGAGSLYERLFGAQSNGLVALKVLGVIVAIGMAAWATWQLVKDVLAHGTVSNIAFDAVQVATTTLSAVCLFVSLFTTAAVFPIAGAVLALIGFIVGFIAQFVDKPKNPVEEWMKDYGVPFARTLPSPAPAFA